MQHLVVITTQPKSGMDTVIKTIHQTTCIEMLITFYVNIENR